MTNPVLDTLIWLIDVPASNGFAFVFIAIFGGLGGLVLFAATGREEGRPLPGSIIVSKLLTTAPVPLLAAARERTGLHRASPPPSRRIRPARLLSAVLLALILAGGALGILGIARVPVAHAYIAAHGTETEASIDGQWVTFTAADGREYTLHNAFHSPSTYPGWEPTIGYDEETVTVRYLPTHPQAFVIMVEEQ